VQAGEPPRASPRPKDAIEQVVADWLKRDQAGNASHAEVKRALDKDVMPVWQGRLIQSIERRDVLEIIDDICDRGRTPHARHVHAYLHRLMRWCVGRGILDTNPMAGLPKPGSASKRDRALSDAEIGELWAACKVLAWPFGPLVQTLLLTAARREEIGALRWDEVHGGKGGSGEIRLAGERTKNREPRAVPLSPLAWQIIIGGLEPGQAAAGCAHAAEHGLAVARSQADSCHQPGKARHPATSDRKHPRPHERQQGRHRCRLPAAQVRGREACCAQSLGQPRADDYRLTASR
jgi:hypothetical protein